MPFVHFQAPPSFQAMESWVGPGNELVRTGEISALCVRIPYLEVDRETPLAHGETGVITEMLYV